MWQVRGYDIAVMTIIAGKTGWIVIDPLLTEEAAAAAMELAQGARSASGPSPRCCSATAMPTISAVSAASFRRTRSSRRKIPVVAPHGFAEEAVSENVLAGNAMTRRSAYMFGTALAPGAEGRVDNGLGTGLSIGTTGYLAPNMLIGPEGGLKVIDGVRFDFMDAAGTEAPAEFLFYLPDFKVLHTTEVAVKTLHNILTLRGAQVRDALRWSKIIDGALVKWGGEAQVQIASHNWPTWGQGRVAGYLENQRDAYRYVHDRTLGRANAGMTLHEVADGIAEPSAQQQAFASRGYYGTVNHNMKATYQRYYGWWDGVPANFNPLPPVAAAKGYVELAGGADALLAAGRKAQGQGNHRWAAELLNHLVFADPPMQRPRPRWPTATRRWALPPNRASGATITCQARQPCAAPNCPGAAAARKAAASSARFRRRSSSMPWRHALPPSGQATCARRSTSSCPTPRKRWAYW